MLERGDVKLTHRIPDKALLWRNDYEVWKWCRQHTLISDSEHLDWLGRVACDESLRMFGIQNNGKDVGVCGLTSIDRTNQKAEFSCYIAPKYRGIGIARKALYLLFRHGFYNMNLNRIWGEVFQGNHALRVFTEKLKMKIEGTQRDAYFRDGKFIQSTIISLLREEFKKYDDGRHYNYLFTPRGGGGESVGTDTSAKDNPPNKTASGKAYCWQEHKC